MNDAGILVTSLFIVLVVGCGLLWCERDVN